MKKIGFVIAVLAIAVVISFIVVNYNILNGAPKSQKPPPVPEVSGKTTADKALSIATIVSQKNQGLLVVDARIANGINATLFDRDTNELLQAAPLWYVEKEAGANAASSMRGLFFAITVVKRGALLAQQDILDVRNALADILSLSAKTFLQGSAKEFSFIEMSTILPSTDADLGLFPFDVEVFHISAQEFLAERNRGENADWQSALESRFVNVQPALLLPVSIQQGASPGANAQSAP